MVDVGEPYGKYFVEKYPAWGGGVPSGGTAVGLGWPSTLGSLQIDTEWLNAVQGRLRPWRVLIRVRGGILVLLLPNFRSPWSSSTHR